MQRIEEAKSTLPFQEHPCRKCKWLKPNSHFKHTHTHLHARGLVRPALSNFVHRTKSTLTRLSPTVNQISLSHSFSLSHTHTRTKHTHTHTNTHTLYPLLYPTHTYLVSNTHSFLFLILLSKKNWLCCFGLLRMIQILYESCLCF